MKSLLGRKWHRVPVIVLAVIMTLVLTTSVALAVEAYPFFTSSTTVSVSEPVLATEYNLNGNYGGDSEWHDLGDLDSQTLERSAGDNFLFDLRFTTDLDVGQELTINTLISGAGSQYFVYAGFPEDSVIGQGVSQTFNCSIYAPGSVPPDDHTITLTFTRE